MTTSRRRTPGAAHAQGLCAGIPARVITRGRSATTSHTNVYGYKYIHHTCDTPYPVMSVARLCRLCDSANFPHHKTSLLWRNQHCTGRTTARGFYFLEPQSRNSPRHISEDSLVAPVANSSAAQPDVQVPATQEKVTTKAGRGATAGKLVYKDYDGRHGARVHLRPRNTMFTPSVLYKSQGGEPRHDLWAMRGLHTQSTSKRATPWFTVTIGGPQTLLIDYPGLGAARRLSSLPPLPGGRPQRCLLVRPFRSCCWARHTNTRRTVAPLGRDITRTTRTTIITHPKTLWADQTHTTWATDTSPSRTPRRTTPRRKGGNHGRRT